MKIFAEIIIPEIEKKLSKKRFQSFSTRITVVYSFYVYIDNAVGK